MISFEPPPRSLSLLLLCSALFLGLSGPVAETLSERAQARLTQAQTAFTAVQRQLKQGQEDAKTAETLRQSLTEAEIEKLLEPGNPERVVAKLEPLAAESRLANMVYVMSPPQPWDGAPDFPGIHGMIKSELSIEADAPHDGDIFSFLSQLNALPGKSTIKELHIAPLHEGEADKLGALNLHMTASIVWLANAPDEEVSP